MLNPFANRKLLKRGETVRAQIVEMSAREHGAEPSKVTMALAVDFRGGVYEVRDRWMIPGTEPIGVDSKIWVAVDPENHHRVAIDWDRTRADYQERTNPRRRVFAAGIPVPVTKVKAALEQAGETAPVELVKEVELPVEVEEPEPEVEPEPAEIAAVPDEDEADRLLAPLGAPPHPLAGMSMHERELLSEHPSLPIAEPTPPVTPPVPAPKRRKSDVIKAKPAKRRKRAATKPPPGPVAPAPEPTRASRASDDDDLTSKLERLAALHDAGALTDGEFSAAKAHVLG